MGLASLNSMNSGALSQRLLSLNNLPSSALPSSAANPAVRNAPNGHASPAANAADTGGIQDSFNQITYTSRMQRMSLLAQFQEVSAQFEQSGEDGASAAAVSARQMSFDFFFESKEETLVAFNQRTGQVAEGLDGARQSSYLATSQQVAARFQFSMSVSAAALEGFAGASEQAQDAQDPQALIDQLIGFTQQLMDAGNEFMNQFLSVLSGNNTGEEQFSFEDLFQNLVREFLSSLSGGNHADPAQTASGQTFQSVSVQMNFSFEFSAEVTVQQGQVQQSDPIMLDLDGDGFELSSHAQGARFDILGSGQAVATAFVNGGDAFLALDRNNDGIINSGKELFGDQYGAANGYEELRKLDGNSDGVINDQDTAYNSLLLFKDNGNGATEAGELISLADAGIAEINLNYRNINEQTSGGNRLAQIGAYRRTDGAYGQAADAILNYVA